MSILAGDARDRLVNIERRLDEIEAHRPTDGHSVAKDAPMEDFRLGTYLEPSSFSTPTPNQMMSIWLAHSAALVLRTGNCAGTKELTALAAILKHMLDDDGLKKVCKDIQRFIEMKETP